MRILMVSAGYPPEALGGGESQCRKLSAELASQGHRVTVVTSTHALRSSGAQTIDGVLIRRFYSRHPPQKLGRFIGSTAVWTVQFALWWCRKRHSFDVIHCHQAKYPAALAIWLSRNRVPVIAKVGDGGRKFDLSTLKRKRLVGRRLERTVRSGVSSFVAITTQIGGDLLDAGIQPERVAHIPNGVAVPCGQDPMRRSAVRGALEIDERSIVVLYCGRFAQEKNLEAAILAWGRKRSNVPALMLLVGTGPTEGRLQQLARAVRAVRILPPVEDISGYLAAADFVVLPSIEEGLSNFVLEGLAAGRPALVTPVGGNSDLIDDGVNGLVADGTSTAALAELFSRSLELGREQTVALSQGARSCADQDYSLESVATAYTRLYEHLT